MSKSYNIEQLIIIAQAINYKQPEYNIDRYTVTDLINSSVHEAINSEFQTKTMILLSQKMTPIKLALKRYLNQYIEVHCKNT